MNSTMTTLSLGNMHAFRLFMVISCDFGFSLEGNLLGEVGAKAVAEVIASSNRLTAIDLSECQILIPSTHQPYSLKTSNLW